jgi:hypothetical protein
MKMKEMEEIEWGILPECLAYEHLRHGVAGRLAALLLRRQPDNRRPEQ